MILIVSVTDEDVRRSKPGDACDCALALAVNRALREAGTIYREAVVTHWFVSLYPGAKEVALPPSATIFVRAVDGHNALDYFDGWNGLTFALDLGGH